jgi:predicted nucleic acid-binding protein
MSQVISNTSPLTNLAIIGRLELVRTQLTGVVVPAAVWREMLALPHAGGRESLLEAHKAGWLRVVTIASTAVASSLRLSGLDEGESEAIALAVETSAELLLIDEKKGRRAARRLAVPVTGALGILAKGRRMGDVQSVSEEIARLRTEAGFFISEEVEARILQMAGEG